MGYVVDLKMDQKKRAAFNERFSDMAYNFIMAFGVGVPIFLALYFILCVLMRKMGITAAIVRFLVFVNPSGVIMMTIDAIDHLLSLQWTDLQAEGDIQKALVNKCIHLFGPVVCGLIAGMILGYLMKLLNL